MPEARIDQVVAIVRGSRRYGRLHERTLRRVAEQALAVEGGRVQPAAKRAKRSLHQIFGAYLPERPRYERLLARLRAGNANDPAALRATLIEAMTEHASTRERLAILERFYREIFERVGRVQRVLDLACGLNPLALPWMNLASEAHYSAVDVDADLVGFVAECLSLLGVEHDVRVLDVVEENVEEKADVALLLKLLPCLERQDPEAPVRLLRAVPASRLVVSFPTRSIGGRDKGMRENYSAAFETLLAREGHPWDRLEFPGELVYVVCKDASSSSVSRR